MIECTPAQLEARCRQRGYELSEVMACVVRQDGDRWLVNVNHPAYPKRPRRAPKPDNPSGPGSQLKALLAKFGIHASPTCKCNSMARKMDAWGPDESLNHLEEIVDVMEETAQKRGLPFIRTAARLLVRRAISKSRALIRRGGR